MDRGIDGPPEPTPGGVRDAGIRDVLDSLIHGAATRAGRRGEGAGAGESATPATDLASRGTGAGRVPLPRGIADETTGLYSAAAWGAVVAAEDARWARFRRPCQVVQLEVGGIAAVADRLGEPFAQRLMTVLAEILRDETRKSDLYARPAAWRIQGLLPEQEADRGHQVEERIRERFASRIGPDVPFRLNIGVASPALGGGIPEAFETAESSMRSRASRAVAGWPEGSGGPATAETGTTPNEGRTGVRAALVEIAALHDDRLITDAEYERTRSAILARL